MGQTRAFCVPSRPGQPGPVIFSEVMDQVLIQCAVFDRAEVCQPDADVAVSGAGEGLIESPGFHQSPEAHEQVGALDVSITYQQVSRIQATRRVQQVAIRALRTDEHKP